jgi:aspartyl-tRNA synthetase
MYRTKTCGELRLSHANETVTLAGWVQTVRDIGHLIFIDLRDRYGITQLSLNADSNAALCDQARKLGREYVIQVTGKVIERTSKNADIPTGEIEIFVESLTILNESETPPFTIENKSDGGEELRMKYRYLDIRRPHLKDVLVTRATMIRAMREYLDNKNFIEVETPNLIKSTPEGARDFLVPSRMQQGSFYALPQSPQILKQLLMVAGMDRYYQVVKCYRDEDFRGDRQPEFTQLDCEMSFVNQEDIFETFSGMVKHVFKKTNGVELPDFIRLTYADALKYYGSDKPDLRFDCKIVELNEALPKSEFPVFNNAVAAGNLVAAVNAKGCAAYSRKQLDELTEFVKATHRGLSGLVNIKFNEDGTVKSSVDKFYTEEQLKEIGKAVGAEKGDLILIAAEKASKVRKSLGDLRLELAKRENWIKPGTWSVFWVVDFPLFEKDEDLQYFDSDPLRVRAQTYDMVMNGNEILSGSIRIHQRDLQNRVFNKLGLTNEDIDHKFGFMLNAFRYGAPPHGGCAFGIDRWVMLMTGGETIRDSMAFPKASNGRDLMMDAPALVDPKQLQELGIATVAKD